MINNLVQEDLLEIVDLIAELSHCLTNLAIDLEKEVNKSFGGYPGFRG